MRKCFVVLILYKVLLGSGLKMVVSVGLKLGDRLFCVEFFWA